MLIMHKSGFYDKVGAENFCIHIDEALERAKVISGAASSGNEEKDMHQKCSIGNLTMMHYLLRYYLNPTDFNMLIYTTQCLQGDYQEMAIRHLRSHRERCAGSTYWQVNDTYPTMSWATIDYYGRWKGAHYIVKRSYQPFIAYAEPDKATGEMVVYAS